jgi:selenide,water dikinase
MDKAHEAGIHIVGGHTIDDKEPKYGLVVTGEVEEEHLIRNDTARVGDELVLTKPLGTGIIATALKRGIAPEDVVAQATETMTTLNRGAAEAAREVGVSAMTDVTGFGLLGHLLELITASNVQASINMDALPVLPGVLELAAQEAPTGGGINIPGGTRRNLAHAEKFLTLKGRISEIDQIIAADAQTSGGLLMAVEREKRALLITRLQKAGTPAATMVGTITIRGEPRITLYRK